MGLYLQLLKQKEQGKEIKLKDLNKQMLYELYIKQRVSDREIAELCNCKKESVSAKRSKLGILLWYRQIEAVRFLCDMLQGFDVIRKEE